MAEQIQLNKQRDEQRLEEQSLSRLEHAEYLREKQESLRELQRLNAAETDAAKEAARKATEHEEERQEKAKREVEAARNAKHREEQEKTRREAEAARRARQLEEHAGAEKDEASELPSQAAKRAFDAIMTAGGSQDDAINAAVGTAVEQAKSLGWELSPLKLAQAAGDAARDAGAAPIVTGDVIGRTAKGAASTPEEAIHSAAKAADLVGGSSPDEASKNVARLVRFAALAAGAKTDQAAELAAQAAKETAAKKNNYSPREVGKRVTMAAKEAGVRVLTTADELGSDAEEETKAQRAKLKAVEKQAAKEEKAAAARVAKDKKALQAAMHAGTDGNNVDDDLGGDADLAGPGLVEASADVADGSTVTSSDEDDPVLDMS